MAEQQTLQWESGVISAPLPPMASLQEVSREERPFVALYRIYGPVFRLPQAGKEPLTVLAGTEANIFMARHEDEFFSTREHWEKFDATITQKQSSMTEARDGAANRKRRAESSRQWSRARILDQIPQTIALILNLTSGWPGSSVPAHASMRRLVAEQLGQLLLGFSPGDYLDDFIVYLNTAITNTLDSSMKSSGDLDSEAYQRASQRVREFSRKAYEAHLVHPQPTGRPDMIDDAIQEMQAYPEAYRKTMLEMVALGPMLAGID